VWLGGERRGMVVVVRLVVSTVLDRGRRNQEPGGHQCVGSERTAREEEDTGWGEKSRKNREGPNDLYRTYQWREGGRVKVPGRGERD